MGKGQRSQVAGGGSVSDWGVRQPNDDIERFKARLALASGAGISIEDFLTKIIGEAPDEALVEAVKMRLEQAQESEQAIDIQGYVKDFIAWRESLA